jgi:hypothetical protein
VSERKSQFVALVKRSLSGIIADPTTGERITLDPGDTGLCGFLPIYETRAQAEDAGDGYVRVLEINLAVAPDPAQPGVGGSRANASLLKTLETLETLETCPHVDRLRRPCRREKGHSGACRGAERPKSAEMGQSQPQEAQEEGSEG